MTLHKENRCYSYIKLQSEKKKKKKARENLLCCYLGLQTHRNLAPHWNSTLQVLQLCKIQESQV